MLLNKNSEKTIRNNIKKLFTNKTFHRAAIGLMILIIAYIIVESGAAPVKYKLKVSDKSPYDITAPESVENTYRTKSNAEKAKDRISPIMVFDETLRENTNIKLKKIFEILKNAKSKKTNSGVVQKEIEKLDLTLTDKQIENVLEYKLVLINQLEQIVTKKIDNSLSEDITVKNLANEIEDRQKEIDETDLPRELKEAAKIIFQSLIKPNLVEDKEGTEKLRHQTYKEALESMENKVYINKGERIINRDDIVTAETVEILRSLNLLDKGGIDFKFSLGILGLIFMLGFLVVIYMNHFSREILTSRGDLILLGFIILFTLTIGRFIYLISPLAIPIFIATMLISILLDMKLAIMVNFVLVIAMSLITKGDMSFIYMSTISGTLSSYIVSKANQRNKLFMSGVIIGVLNVLIILCATGILNSKLIPMDLLIVFLNGVGSIIVTIGILPFLESTFNIITPLKLLELANPNQPLVKRLLMEAPGTYHHSLMVGNLAEVATESIGGNALLARVGAYFHDIGKLKRPNFFMENQLSDNPHDRMTANLSTLVITSHTNDGVELALKYKIPLAIRDIIQQHHGNTLVVYFYHKAKKGEKGESVVQDNFRYSGPKPSSKEAAVVMLADSVEAAVRSMIDKTEGKIEGLVRKIIKDKLDDGQLDQCDLTLKDLDNIAKGFMKVLSGIFHEREEYPEIKEKDKVSEETNDVNNIENSEESRNENEGGTEIADTD